MYTAKASASSYERSDIDDVDFSGDSIALTAATLRRIEHAVRRQYQEFASGLSFHGWHHVEFVRTKAVSLALKNNADVTIVEAAALLHDLNYMLQRNSRATVACQMRAQLLGDLGISEWLVDRIEQVISEAETESRDEHACLEAQALSDADTLFKALPITPVLLAHKYMEETGQSIRELCDRILMT
jgi:uncharacterized protein